jgi:hypothetical protein
MSVIIRMILIYRCGVCSAAFLFGLASLSAGHGADSVRSPEAVVEVHTALKRKLNAEQRMQRSPAQKWLGSKGPERAPLSRSLRQEGDEWNPATLLAPVDMLVTPHAEAKRKALEPQSSGRTIVEWQQPADVLSSRALWSQHGTINSKVASSDVKLDISGTQRDVARGANAPVSELSFLQPKNRERNLVDDLNLKLSTLNDVLQFTIRESSSIYSADVSYLLDLARKNRDKNSPGPQRFLQLPGEGHAGLQRIDIKLFDSTPMTVTAFGFRKEVDRSYLSFASTKAKDEFATPDQTGETTGLKVRLGAISLTSSYGNYERTSDFARTARQDHTLAWDTSDLRNHLPGIGLEAISPFVPTSLSITRFESQRPVGTSQSRGFERTSGYAANATWKWDSGYGNASYWDYRLDGAPITVPAYGFAGRGFDAGVGAYGKGLEVYGGVSHHRSDDVSSFWNSITSGFDAYAILTYKPSDFPDLSVNGGVGQYDYNAMASTVFSRGSYWSATFSMDFSKWLPRFDGFTPTTNPGENPVASTPPSNRFNLKSPLSDKASLKLFYRYANESGQEIAGGHWSDSHLIAATLSRRL